METNHTRLIFRYRQNELDTIDLYRDASSAWINVQVPIGRSISGSTYRHYTKSEGETKFAERLMKFTKEEWELFYLTEVIEGRGSGNGS
jgi:hypothetical protein